MALKSSRYLISREMRDLIKLILIDPKQQPVYLKNPRLKWEPQLQSTRLAISYILPSGFVQMVGTPSCRAMIFRAVPPIYRHDMPIFRDPASNLSPPREFCTEWLATGRAEGHVCTAGRSNNIPSIETTGCGFTLGCITCWAWMA